MVSNLRRRHRTKVLCIQNNSSAPYPRYIRLQLPASQANKPLTFNMIFCLFRVAIFLSETLMQSFTVCVMIDVSTDIFFSFFICFYLCTFYFFSFLFVLFVYRVYDFHKNNKILFTYILIAIANSDTCIGILSVCLSVCLSVRHCRVTTQCTSVIGLARRCDGWTDGKTNRTVASLSFYRALPCNSRRYAAKMAPTSVQRHFAAQTRVVLPTHLRPRC